MAKTFLDALVEYPAKVMQEVGADQQIVALLTDIPDVDVESDEADDIFDNYLCDHCHVDNTTTEARAFVCIEAEMCKAPTPTIQDMRLYVTVICHHNYMKLDPSKFPGVIGNRRDNLVRDIDRVLNGSDVFGIGLLTLDSVKTVSSPTGFTARELTYRVSDFKNKGVIRP